MPHHAPAGRLSLLTGETAERIAAIKAAILAHPDWPLQRIAAELGVSFYACRVYTVALALVGEIPPRKHSTRAKPDRNAAIVERLERGDVTMADLAIAFGVTRERVRQIAKKAGITGRDLHTKAIAGARRRSPETAAKREAASLRRAARAAKTAEILRLHAVGVKQSDIAEAVGCSQPVVSVVLIKHGQRTRRYRTKSTPAATSPLFLLADARDFDLSQTGSGATDGVSA